MRTPTRRPRRVARCAWAALLTWAAAGCQSGATSALARWGMATDKTIAKAPTREEAYTEEGQTLLGRWLSPKAPPHAGPDASPSMVLGANGFTVPKVAPNPEADAELRAAMALFQQGKLEEAEPALAAIAKKRKETPWGEKAQFYLAETQYQRGRLVQAHDSFEEFHKTYPGSSRFTDKTVAREFAIAEAWLSADDPKAPPDKRIAWYERFTGRRPLADTFGNAMSALEHVRHNDPMGPLADDATMEIADRHFRAGDYESSAIYYDELLKQHAKSPFVPRAQLALIDSYMKGYIGPDYDGTGLEKAKETARQALAIAPTQAPGTSEALYHTLDLISDQMAERAFRRGEYYRKTGHVISAEYYFAMVPSKWPKSPWAQKAKVELAGLAKLPRKESKPSKIMTLPGSNDPFTGGVGGGGLTGMNGLMGPNTGAAGPGGGTY